MPGSDRVASKVFDKLGLRFIDYERMVNEIGKQTTTGRLPAEIADAMVDEILPDLSRDEVRGQLETLAWQVRDELTGGNP